MRGIRKSFAGNIVLEHVNLTARSGEALALVKVAGSDTREHVLQRAVYAYEQALLRREERHKGRPWLDLLHSEASGLSPTLHTAAAALAIAACARSPASRTARAASRRSRRSSSR